MPAATTVGVLSQLGVGFPVAAAVGATLLVTALGLAVQALRPPRAALVAGGCLLGTVGVLAQLLLTAGEPASRGGFLLGLVGASAWYGAGVQLLADRLVGLGRQWLTVGSLLWIGGTVTVTATAAPANWPLVWCLLLGLALLAVTVLVWLAGPDSVREWDRQAGLLSGAFLAPSVLGVLAGEEILFVAYVLAFAMSLVCWSLVGLALRQSP